MNKYRNKSKIHLCIESANIILYIYALKKVIFDKTNIFRCIYIYIYIKPIN